MTDTERIKEDLANKLKLEESLARRLKGVFKDIRADLKKQVERGATFFSSQNWQVLFYNAFYDHYLDVADIFGQNMQRQLNITATDDEKNMIRNSLVIFFLSTAQKSADEATNTTLKNAAASLLIAQEQQRQSVAEGETFGQETVAVVTDQQMKRKLKGRTKTIKVSETQKAAEASKITEAQVLDTGLTNINTPNTFIPSTNVKDWFGILDDVIRDTHLEADRTQKGVPASDFFIVGGYRLMYPADREHGAPAKETINCRCSALYRLSDDQIKMRG